MAETIVQSAVRIPTPPLESSRPAKRKTVSRSPSPLRSRGPPRSPRREIPHGNDQPEDDDRVRYLNERFRSQARVSVARGLTQEEKQASAKAEYEKLLNARSGGVYIPPARLRDLQKQITDETSKEYQRMAWEALKKSINGLINKVNITNIKHIVPELFSENLIRGRGLFCRSIMKAQAASLPFTPLYACLASLVNTKFENVGQLLVHRLVLQFQKAYRRNDKGVCLSSSTFLAQLINYQVIHENLAAEILLLLLHEPTDDRVEIAVGFTREVGQHLEEMSPPIARLIFDQFRNILHEADIDKRVQYMVEILFQVRRDKFKDNKAIKDELDLIEEEDQITHHPSLEGTYSADDGLNVFNFDPEYKENEERYQKLKTEILGESSDEEEEDSEVESEADEAEDKAVVPAGQPMEVKDQTNATLEKLRKDIYFSIKSSLSFEDAVHRLMKIQIPSGMEKELPSMIVEFCAKETTYTNFWGLTGERFAKINRLWRDLFEESFAHFYEIIYRYQTNEIRNIAKFFGHLLAEDAIAWHVFMTVKLNVRDTNSSSRIFLKDLFAHIIEMMTLKALVERLKDPVLRDVSYGGLFPMDPEKPDDTRFAINYFTNIGMGGVTEEMRHWLTNLPKSEPPKVEPPRARSLSSDADSLSTARSSSYSRSDSRGRSRSHSLPPRRQYRRNGPHDTTSRRDRRSLSRSGSRSPARPDGRAADSRDYRDGRGPRGQSSRDDDGIGRRQRRRRSYSSRSRSSSMDSRSTRSSYSSDRNRRPRRRSSTPSPPRRG